MLFRSLQETALREVREETGLEGKIVEKLGDITYWYTNKTKEGETIRIFKRVYFYLIRWLKGDVSRHDDEVEEAAWFPIAKARGQIYHLTERDMVKKAETLLDGRIEKKSPPQAGQAGRV